MFAKVPKLEKRVLGIAIVVAAVHLLLIAYAAMRLGITVPTCITNTPELAKPDFIDHGDNHYEVHVTAKMWLFQPNYIKIPTGSRLDVFLTSQDVLHGFFITNTNVNLMAVPGSIANASVTFHKPGKYFVLCHEYCGTGHQNMQGVIEVVDGLDKYEVAGLPDFTAVQPAVAGASLPEKLASEPEVVAAASPVSGAAPEPAKEPSPEDALIAQGKALYASKGCIGCHSDSGAPGVGPSFKGLYGTTSTLTSGAQQVVDAAFIKQKIKNPSSTTLKGFTAGMMPPLPVTDQEVEALTAYIKSLK